MEIRLTVNADGEYFSGVSCVQIEEPLTKVFLPLNTCDDPRIALATGEYIDGSAAVEEVIKLRDDAADLIARHLTELLLSEMRKKDTHNGYSKEQNKAFSSE